MTRTLLALLTLGLQMSCGYGFSTTQRKLRIDPIAPSGADVDAHAVLTRAVIRALLRSPGIAIDAENPDSVLRLALDETATSNSAFADPGRRATEPISSMRVSFVLTATSGRVLLESRGVSASAQRLTPPGPLPALEGSRRQGISDAADEVAESIAARIRALP